MMERLANEIIAGRRLGKNDDLSCLLTADLHALCAGADRIRAALCGNKVSLCSIVNAKSGKCSENCKFCAQSAHHCTEIDRYGFLPAEEILALARHNAGQGVHRFSIVTAGRALSGGDFEAALAVIRTLRDTVEIGLCASMGLLTAEQFVQLKAAGVTRYHCNLETSRRNFPNICSTHTYQDKLDALANAKAAGLELCSGGIIGMGETWADRLDMACDLAELGVASIPLNALTPIPGTPLAENAPLTEAEILRTAAVFRYIAPAADIRLAAGRRLMAENGAAAFRSGANAAITGDMLTTSGNSIRADIAMLQGLGLDPEK